MNHCTITIAPRPHGNTIGSMDVTAVLSGLSVKAGEELFRMQIETVTIPGCEAESLTIKDLQGEVPYTDGVDTPYPYKWHRYYPKRDTQGEVTLSYTVFPREWKPEHTCGPYFDLKAEEGGVTFSGLAVLPDVEGFEGELTLNWDLSALPAGSRGVNTFGEGKVAMTAPLEKLRQSYYAAGQLCGVTDGDFGFYWFGRPPFDVAAIAEYVKKLYAVMAPFFRDDQSVYRVFMRKDPYQNSGGTALLRSYLFGWNETQPVSVEEKQNILAHEMVHNWPHLNDNPYGTASWYSEGTAEYYSIILPLRAGLITKEQALREIQTRTHNYYTNPTRHLENVEAAKICWQDRRAQRLPYGRGIFFLANSDLKIRQATGGKYTIDDVVLRIQELDRAGITLGNEVFLSVVKELSGLDLREDWEIMRTGGHFAPMSGTFDGHFDVREVPAAEADTGKEVVSYEWTLR